MTYNQLASKVAKIEGKKSQASIGNVRETIKVLLNLLATDADSLEFFNEQVVKRAAKAQKRASKK